MSGYPPPNRGAGWSGSPPPPILGVGEGVLEPPSPTRGARETLTHLSAPYPYCHRRKIRGK